MMSAAAINWDEMIDGDQLVTKAKAPTDPPIDVRNWPPSVAAEVAFQSVAMNHEFTKRLMARAGKMQFLPSRDLPNAPAVIGPVHACFLTAEGFKSSAFIMRTGRTGNSNIG